MQRVQAAVIWACFLSALFLASGFAFLSLFLFVFCFFVFFVFFVWNAHRCNSPKGSACSFMTDRCVCFGSSDVKGGSVLPPSEAAWDGSIHRVETKNKDQMYSLPNGNKGATKNKQMNLPFQVKVLAGAQKKKVLLCRHCLPWNRMSLHSAIRGGHNLPWREKNLRRDKGEHTCMVVGQQPLHHLVKVTTPLSAQRGLRVW